MNNKHSAKFFYQQFLLTPHSKLALPFSVSVQLDGLLSLSLYHRRRHFWLLPHIVCPIKRVGGVIRCCCQILGRVILKLSLSSAGKRK